MTLAVTKIAETDTTITVGWTPVAGQEGAVGTLDGSELLADGKRHVSTNQSLSSIKFAKKLDGKEHDYGVSALGVVASGSVRSGTALPPPPPPPPPTGINTWEYGQAIPQPRVKNPKVIDVTSKAELDLALKTLQPGQSIRGHGFSYAGLDIRNRNLPDYAEIDLTDNVTVNGKGPSGRSLFLGWNHKLHVFGGTVTEYGSMVYSLVDCAWMDTLISHTLWDGSLIFGTGSPIQRCVFRLKASDCCYDMNFVNANDPHPTKGTGLHAFNIADSQSWIEDSMLILDVVNQHTGAGAEVSNLRKGALSTGGLVPGGSGVQFWLRANGLLFKSNGQTAANGIQFWGGSGMITNACEVHYIEVNNAQGKVVEAGWADGPFSGVDVEYGRGHNVNLLHPGAAAFQPYQGMTYHDCKVV